MNNDPDSILAKILGEKASDMVARIERETFEESSEFDKVSTAPDHVRMNVPTREEIDAKLETIEAKMDGRLARIEDKINDLIQSHRGMRSSVWGAAAVTIGAVLAGFALVVASFDSGRDTAAQANQAPIIIQVPQQAAPPPAPQPPANP